MKRLVSPLLLVLILSTMSVGWRTAPARHATSLPAILDNPVNMTLDGGRLFVSDGYTGLHVYDVADPAAPRRVGHIPLESNRGSAVKDDVVYTNDAGQLVALRATDNAYTVVARIGVKYREVDGPLPGPGDVSSFSCMCTTTDYAAGPAAPGGGSSYATFAVVGNQLYRVEGGTIVVYDVTTADKPTEAARVDAGWDIETIHPSPNFLFIGGQRGMYIFDRSDPVHPKQISKIEHARACDPVVVSGSTAYVTLRGSSVCGASPDELLCVNIKDPRNPGVVGQKAVTTPYGLAVRNARLYVSHGVNGYSLMDVTDPQAPVLKKTWTGDATRDFIWSENTLFVLNDHNVSIYDVTDPLAPVLLSRVSGDTSL